MKIFFIKLICVSLILVLLSSCMTIRSDNRSESMSELRKVKKVSTSKVPLENTIGPVYRISALSTNAGLMIAGQMCIELGYKYFVMLNNSSISNVSGYFYQSYGGVSTTTEYTITVAFTNDENTENKYNAYECSALMDGYTFTTFGGRVACWTLFGSFLVGGTVVMLSFSSGLVPGGVLMGASVLFTIPLFY